MLTLYFLMEILREKKSDQWKRAVVLMCWTQSRKTVIFQFCPVPLHNVLRSHLQCLHLHLLSYQRLYKRLDRRQNRNDSNALHSTSSSCSRFHYSDQRALNSIGSWGNTPDTFRAVKTRLSHEGVSSSVISVLDRTSANLQKYAHLSH